MGSTCWWPRKPQMLSVNIYNLSEVMSTCWSNRLLGWILVRGKARSCHLENGRNLGPLIHCTTSYIWQVEGEAREAFTPKTFQKVKCSIACVLFSHSPNSIEETQFLYLIRFFRKWTLHLPHLNMLAQDNRWIWAHLHGGGSLLCGSRSPKNCGNFILYLACLKFCVKKWKPRKILVKFHSYKH